MYEDCKKGLNNLKEVHNIYKIFVRILKTHGRCWCEKHKMFIRNARKVRKKYLISFKKTPKKFVINMTEVCKKYPRSL